MWNSKNHDECLRCEGVKQYGECISKEHFNCKISLNNKCIQCKEGYYKTDLKCEKIDKSFFCAIYSNENEICLECLEGYQLTNENDCLEIDTNLKTLSIETEENCAIRTTKGCIRCKDGYYLENSICYQCEGDCRKCLNATYCLECDEYSYVQEGECIRLNELIMKCEQMMTSYDGCVKCKEGYYKSNDGRNCLECDISCNSCINNDGEQACIECNDGYYRWSTNIKLCKNQSEIMNCLNITKEGCIKCEEGYYKTQENNCSLCPQECMSCSSENECSECIENYVLMKNGKCEYFENVEYCLKSKNSACIKCEDGYEPNSNGNECVKQTKNLGLVIGLSVGLSSGFIIIIIIIILIIILTVYFRKQEKESYKGATIFKIYNSNIIFIETNEKKMLLLINHQLNLKKN